MVVFVRPDLAPLYSCVVARSLFFLSRYFGTTGFSEMTSSLLTATGSDQGMLSANDNFHLTGLYHMAVQGMTSLFNYADHGPNK